MIHYSKCPACASHDIRYVLSAKDYTVSKEIYEIWECKACTLRFTQHVPNAANIGRYYKAEQYVSHTDTRKGLINKLYHLVRERTLKQKLRLIRKESALKKGSLLDIGAGTGAFASRAARAGWQVTGLEPDADARVVAKDKFGITLQASEELYALPPESMDVISMWHVLEHVHDLHGYMQALQKILKQRGVLVIAVPNYTSYDAETYRELWAAYDVPRHLYHFSPLSIKQLMSAYQMEVVKTYPMKYDSYYVSMLSEKHKRGYDSFLDAFRMGLKSNAMAKGDPEKFSSVIYIIRRKP